MIVRIKTVGPQETWHRDVMRVWGENGYIKLKLANHPHQVNYWHGCNVLICANDAEVADALRDERIAEWLETPFDRTIREAEAR